MECAKVPSGIRKSKKKQSKDELDRIKQAEKKKRRLEKALATSAAIRSELEKKKQKKKEEQQRLDEEGAATAEAVALQVLLGEDSDDSHEVVLKKDEWFNPWSSACNLDLFMGGKKAILPHQDLLKDTFGGIEWVSNAHRSGCKWNNCGSDGWKVSSGSYYNEQGWEATDISAGVIAVQAVSSLQIAEDAHVDAFMFNRMLA